MAIAKRLTRAEIESIYSAANSAVWRSHDLANRLAMRTPREEDYVATLVTDAVPLLVERWKSLLNLKGIELKISGVFCHGHPQVAFGTPRSQVELADLLVVHQHTSKTRATSRAMLVQAKMSTDATRPLPSSDKQLVLFSQWPKFEFVSGGLLPGLRDLKETGRGSRYALVHSKRAYPENITWADQCPWAACPASQVLSADRSFAKLLGDMLIGKDGRVVQLHAPKDDWSRTIKELLEVTGKKTYKRKNIARGDTSRRSGPVGGLMHFNQTPSFAGDESLGLRRSVSDLFFGTVPVAQPDGLEGEPPESASRNESEGGMSVLIMESRDVNQC